MPVAPRYNPDGVRVGSMPVPQVRAQTGTADALASVGQTIAGLGQTIDHVQARQEQRANDAERQQVAADHAAKVKADVAAAGGQEAYKKWKRDMDAAYDKLRVEAQGSLVADKTTQFQDGLTVKDPTAYLPPGASAEMTAAFQARVDYESQTFKLASNNLALERNRAYVASVSSDEVKDAVSSAGSALAGGDGEDAHSAYVLNIGRAAAAARRVADITGREVSLADLQGSAAFDALEKTAKGGSDELTLQKYDMLKNSNLLGSAADNAERFIAPIRKNVEVNNKAKELVFQSTMEDGNIDFNEAMANAGKLSIPYEDVAKIQLRISQAAAADEKQREAIGETVIAQLGAAQHRTKFDPNQFMAQPGMDRAIKRMLPKQQLVMADRIARGPEFSNPEHKAEVWSLLYNPAEKQRVMAVRRGDYSLTNADWEAFDKARNKQPDPIEDKVQSEVKKLWTDNGRKPPLPHATSETALDAEQIQEIADFEDVNNYIMGRLADDKAAQAAIKKGESIDRFIAGYYKDATTKAMANEGGEMVPIMAATQYRNGFPFVLTDDIRKRAGNPDNTDPQFREKIWEARTAMEREKAGQEQEAERARSLTDIRRPQTDAALMAQREVIGTAWRAAKPGDRLRRVVAEADILAMGREQAAERRRSEAAANYSW